MELAVVELAIDRELLKNPKMEKVKIPLTYKIKMLYMMVLYRL